MSHTLHPIAHPHQAKGWLNQAKWAFTTRRVDRRQASGIAPELLAQARPGDLLVARVEQIGFQKRLQLAEGRPATLYTGDLVVLACGARYAPDQFEGVAELDGPLVDLLAAGGLAGRMRQRNGKVGTPTQLVPLGLLTDTQGQVLNLQRYALPARPSPAGLTVIVVVGASMNSGKTVATASLAHGLTRAGYRVAAIKATGTGAFGDYQTFQDAGAHYVADFTDVGMASTYQEPLARLEAGLQTLLAGAAQAGCEVAVVEFADGVLQQETAALLRQRSVQALIGSVLLAAPDALSAFGGHQILQAMGLPVCALSGTLTLSPLASAEAMQSTDLAVLRRDELCDPAKAGALLHSVLDTAPAALLLETA